MNWRNGVADTNWLRQTADKPLFPNLLWSRPQNRQTAGKLLIIGGNLHGFAAPAAAFASAVQAGIGTARVVLPSALQKSLGKDFKEAQFAPNTPSGSFSREALSLMLETAKWADGVLLAGDFGRNSETSVLLESFVQKYEGKLTVAADGLDYFTGSSSSLLERGNTSLVINLGRLQKLAKNNRPSTPILHNMGLHELVTVLADWTNSTPISFITKHADNFLVAVGGQVSTTPHKTDEDWQIKLAAYVSVWSLQQPQQVFEALTSAVLSFLNDT
jgi:hypothetical protein